ncbi:MAG: hypothetical protein H7315_15280 [Herminiimonas sp.]|nr:hypothetical protein [Herminiimonas sp.]
MTPQPQPIDAVHNSAHKKRLSAIWLIACAIGLTVTGGLIWKNHGSLIAKLSPLDPKSATRVVPIDKEMEKIAGADGRIVARPRTAAQSTLDPTLIPTLTPAVPGNVAGHTPVIAAPSADTTQILDRLTKLDVAVAGLTSEVAKLSVVYSASAATPASDVQHADMPIVKHVAKRKKTTRIAKTIVSVDPEPTAKRSPAPDVLSVDTWNGKASVAVRNGGEVRFISEGERAGNFELKGADKDNQRAYFVDATGSVSVKERQER